MTKRPDIEEDIDWSLTTWEGSRRAQMELWAKMSLDEIFAAQEAMAELSQELAGASSQPSPTERTTQQQLDRHDNPNVPLKEDHDPGE